MKKMFLFAAVAAVLSVACDDPVDNMKYSLSAEPSSLTFDAVGAAVQTVTVEAENVEWDCEVPEVYGEWLTASRDGDIVSVAVTDNETTQTRTGVVSIKAVNGEVKGVSVSITQQGGADPVDYSLKVDPTYLNFAGEEAAAQDVIVTATEGMTWTAEPDSDWITVNVGEGKFTVSVSDNPDTAERRGTVTVTPGEDSVEPRTVSVIQGSRRVFAVDNTEDMLFSFNLGMTASITLNVTAVGVNWNVAVEAINEGDDVSWLDVYNNTTNVVVTANSVNKEETERTAYVVFTTDWDELPELRIKATQEAARQFFSTLTGDVDLNGVLKFNRVSLYPWEPDDNKGEWTQINDWSFDLWSDGVEFDNLHYDFLGTGQRLTFSLTSPRIEKNEEEIYYIPTESPYEVVDQTNMPEDISRIYTIKQGAEPSFLYTGFYYLEYKDDEVVNYAPIVEGTVTVTRDGDVYTFDIDVKDDFGWSIKGTYSGEVHPE